MSKSNPDSAIFMEDSEADVNSKIKKAFCAPGEVEGNPCLAYIRMLVLPWFGRFEVTRREANGGDRCGKGVFGDFQLCTVCLGGCLWDLAC